MLQHFFYSRKALNDEKYRNVVICDVEDQLEVGKKNISYKKETVGNYYKI